MHSESDYYSRPRVEYNWLRRIEELRVLCRKALRHADYFSEQLAHHRCLEPTEEDMCDAIYSIWGELDGLKAE